METIHGFSAQQTMGRTIAELLHCRWIHPEDEALCWKSLETTGCWQGEIIDLGKNGKKVYVEITANPMSGASQEAGIFAVRWNVGEPQTSARAHCHPLGQRDVKLWRRTLALRGLDEELQPDITQCEDCEQALRESNVRLQALVDSIEDVIFEIDVEGTYLNVWAADESLLARPQKELIGRRVEDLVGAEAAGRFKETYRRVHRTARPENVDFALELRGETHWFSARVNRIGRLGEASGRLSLVVRDVTQRKEAQNSLRRLSARLLHLQDEERRRLARELHDSTAQTLSALSINLAVLKKLADLSSSPVLERAMHESLDLAAQASKELRTFSYLLHPPLLDEAGLAEALRWYVEGFVERTGIEVDLAVIPAEPRRLHPDIEIAVFRVVQESLTNVYRHSGSSTAGVRLQLNSDRTRLEIWDRGRGLPAWRAKQNGDLPATIGVGIRGMGERIRQLGGSMRLRDNRPGTRVEVLLPSGAASRSLQPSIPWASHSRQTKVDTEDGIGVSTSIGSERPAKVRREHSVEYPSGSAPARVAAPFVSG